MVVAGTVEHTALMIVLLAVSVYAGVSLLRDPVGASAVAGRLWLLITCGVIAADGLAFGGNALLLFAYQIGISVTVVQVAYLLGTIVAIGVWDRR
jgi:hypothetical protein